MAAIEFEEPGHARRAARAWPFALAGARLAAWLDAERESWFFWTPVAMGCGIGAYFLSPNEPSPLAALAPLGPALALRWMWRRAALLSALASALLLAALGFALAKARTEAARAPVLARQIGPVEITGYVERVEPRPSRGQRITLGVTDIAGLGAEARPRRVRFHMAARFGDVRAGGAIRLRAVLAPPAPPVAPGDYDFARAAWFESIGGAGYAVSKADIDASAPPPWSTRANAAIEEVRRVLGDRIVAALPGQTGAIARALITGERGGIEPETNRVYKASGLFHILSISGLHMAIVAGSLFAFSRLGFAAFPAIALRFPIKKWAALVAAAGALAYLLISGGAFATLRSGVMIAIMFLAILLDRPAIALRNVALAALVILTLWPESLLDAGFQMSFSAVAALVAVYEEIRLRARGRERERVRLIWRAPLFLGGVFLTTLVASLAVAPFGAYHFHETQQYALLANAAAIPICNFAVMPAALATLFALPFGLEAAPLWIMGKGIDAMTWSAGAVAGLPRASLRVPAVSSWAFALMAAGGLWLLLWRTRARFAGLPAIAAGLAFAAATPRPDILIGQEGRLVAARGADGRLSALPAARAAFELGRWLARDGDGRTPKDAATGEGFACDGVGCVAKVKGLTISVALNPAALRDDCARAGVVIVRGPRPRGCDRPAAVIDIFALKALGAHAIFIDDGGRARIETARSAASARPWSEPPAWAKNRRDWKPRTPEPERTGLERTGPARIRDRAPRSPPAQGEAPPAQGEAPPQISPDILDEEAGGGGEP